MRRPRHRVGDTARLGGRPVPPPADKGTDPPLCRPPHQALLLWGHLAPNQAWGLRWIAEKSPRIEGSERLAAGERGVRVARQPLLGKGAERHPPTRVCRRATLLQLSHRLLAVHNATRDAWLGCARVCWVYRTFSLMRTVCDSALWLAMMEAEKCSARDLGRVMASGGNGGTTVAGTLAEIIAAEGSTVIVEGLMLFADHPGTQKVLRLCDHTAVLWGMVQSWGTWPPQADQMKRWSIRLIDYELVGNPAFAAGDTYDSAFTADFGGNNLVERTRFENNGPTNALADDVAAP